MIRTCSLFLLLSFLGFSVPAPTYAQLCFNGLTTSNSYLVQKSESQDGSDTTFLRGSNRAIIFDFDLLSLNGLHGGVGAKWWLSSSSALRTTVDLTIQSREDTNGTLSNGGRNSIDFGLTGFIELHSKSFGPTERLSPYMGAGLRFGAGAFSDKTDFPLGNVVQQRKDQGAYVDFTALIGFGVEYRVARRVSFAGEHTFGATVRKESLDTSEMRRDEPDFLLERDITSFTLGTGTSSLILAIYF